MLQLFGTPAARLMPAGIHVADTICAPNLLGVDATTGRLADGLGAQMEQALERLRDVLAEAGGSLANVARVAAYVSRPADREPIYGPWDQLFPDPRDRPAFKVLVAPLPPGVHVRLDMLARLNASRRRLDIEGIPARDPTVLVGPWLMTSRVHGTEPGSGQVPADLSTETRQAFENIATLLRLAGFAADDLSQLLVFVRDAQDARHVRETLRQVFPTFGASSLTVIENFVPPSMHLMVEAIAAQDAAGVREIITQPEVDPIPSAVRLGNLVFGAAITGEGADFRSQLQAALRDTQATLDASGLSLADIGQVGVYMRDLSWKPILNELWAALFPNPDDRPPHKYVPLDDSPDPARLVQLQVLAVAGASRRVLEIPGMAHGDPMSMGARVGPYVFSSRIVGTDTSTGQTPTDAEQQVRLAFRNMQTLLGQAGTSLEGVAQVNAYINDDDGKELTLRAWRELFPADAPSLRLLNARLPGSTAVRLEVFAAC